jgi:cytochrome P450
MPAGAQPPFLARTGRPVQGGRAKGDTGRGAVSGDGRGRVGDQVSGVNDDRLGAARGQNGLEKIMSVFQANLAQRQPRSLERLAGIGARPRLAAIPPGAPDATGPPGRAGARTRRSGQQKRGLVRPLLVIYIKHHIVPVRENRPWGQGCAMAAVYDLDSAAYYADPYPTYTRMRHDDPAYFNPALGLWILTRYADVYALSRERRTSVARVDQLLSAVSPELHDKSQVVNRFLSDWLVFSDPPRHTIMRRLQTRAFSARNIAALEPYIQKVVDETLDGLQGAGEIDVIGQVSVPIPAKVIAHMLGVPPEDVDAFKAWTSAVFRVPAWVGDPDENLEAAYDGVVSLDGYFRELIAARRKEPTDDLLSALVQAEQDGQFLNEHELVASCALLLLAGHETTTNVIGNGVLALLRHPAELARLRADRSLMDTAVEEFTRYDSASGGIARVLLEDLEFGGQVIPAGQAAAGLPQAANRDPEAFEDADRFDVGRHETRNMNYGGGPHLCLGAALARLETKVAVSTLLDRFPRMELADDNLVWLRSIAIRGVERLPVSI